MSYRKMLDEAINLFGFNDIVTVMLSQKVDKEIVEQQEVALNCIRGKYEEGR